MASRDQARSRGATPRRAGRGRRAVPARSAGALLARQEARPRGPSRAWEIRLGEPARFPPPLALLLPRGRPDATGIDLYIELI